MNQMVYINGLGNVSPQPVAVNGAFPEELQWYETNRMKCIDPGYKEFIPADQIRRMGRIIKMGVAAARLCLRDASEAGGSPDQTVIPEAIITGTGLGCIEDTEKFLSSMIRNNEEFLTPTSFIQSTHNTVAGQIALLIKCHGYNFTFVHRGISFESALTDSVVQLHTGHVSNLLVGGSDEITDHSFAITSRLGHWKRKPVNTRFLFEDSQRGSVAGEGAAFFFLENKRNPQSYASLGGVTTFLNPADNGEINSRLIDFLHKHKLSIGDIDLVLTGANGDPRQDRIYEAFAANCPDSLHFGRFKHLCGEYHTASAFGTWLGAMILKQQQVPEAVLTGSAPRKLEHILIYNHYRGINHAFILLNRA